MAANVPSHVLVRGAGRQPRANKFGVAPVAERRHPRTGELFASKAELKRWLDLELLEKAGHISKLRRQVHYPLIVGAHYDKAAGNWVLPLKVGTYVADHVYFENGVEVVEDVKGFATPEYRMKKRLMKALHDIEIREVRIAAPR